jgi:pimeloyl-ACP methyl ester carboxylesterase
MKLARDGIQLSFDFAGAGEPEFLFVPGLGGDRTHFASDKVFRPSRSGVDLRGHGERDKPQQPYSFEGFSTIPSGSAAAGDHQAALVGQSIGGNMALEIPAGLVLLIRGP